MIVTCHEKYDSVIACLQVSGLWNAYAYDVGGIPLTLDHIEHGILRCNRPHPATKKALIDAEKDGARAALILPGKVVDCRIHFALNCGAKSCPPVRVYAAEKLDAQLDLAAGSFVSQEVEVTDEEGVIEANKLLMWYSEDFGGSEKEVKATLAKFHRDEKVKRALADDATKLQFRDYNWNINKKAE